MINYNPTSVIMQMKLYETPESKLEIKNRTDEQMINTHQSITNDVGCYSYIPVEFGKSPFK